MLVDHIIRAGTNMTIDQAKVRMMEIDAMKINMSNTPEEMELTYNDLLAKWESIPEAYRGHPYQLYEKLLNLIPTVCADDKKALQTNINIFQTVGMTMPTYSQIGQGIVTSVIKYRHSNPNTLWTAGGGGERPPAGREQGDRRREGKCSNCLGNHNPWECPRSARTRSAQGAAPRSAARGPRRATATARRQSCRRVRRSPR